jgi:hypothetical protein
MSFSFGHPSCEVTLRCFWAPNLRTCLALRCGAQLADVRTCLAFALWTCVRAPNLWTCLALRWGAQLADVPCVTLGRPTLVRLYSNVYLQAKICSYLSSKSSFSLVLPCVDVFVADEFCVWATILRRCGRALHLRCGRALGRPTCGRALRCVLAPNLRTCLVLRLGAHLADVPCVALGCPNLVRPY